MTKKIQIPLAVGFVVLGFILFFLILFKIDFSASKSVPIRSLPFVIHKSGHYQLERNLIYTSSNGVAIEVKADNVSLDLNGFAIETFVPASSQRAMGIQAVGKNDLTIRNGRVSGFFFGIIILDDRKEIGSMEGFGRKLLNLQVTRSKYEAIHIEGRQSLVESCQIRDTGGYRTYNGPPIYVHGISLSGENSIIRNNEVFDTFNWGLPNVKEAVGISVSESFATRIESNTIANRERGCFEGFGIWVTGDNFKVTHTPVFIHGNRVVNFLYGIGFGHISDGIISNNIFYDVDKAFYASAGRKLERKLASNFEAVEYDGMGGSANWTDAGNNLEITSKLNSFRLRKDCSGPSIYAPFLEL